MADELSTPPSTEAGTDSIAKTPAVKKTRAPRRPKAVIEAAKSEMVAAPKGRRGGRRKVDAEALTTPASTPRKVRGPAKAKASTAAVAASGSDGLADLLQLEEENARLRKTLAEKLRAENADLRKRIGS